MKQQVKYFLMTVLFIFTSLALAIFTTVISSTFIYQLLNGFFNWQDQVGISEAALIDNYRRMIDYLIFPGYRQLKLPDFSFSAGGLQHFAEVKVLIQITFIIGIICLIIVGLIIHQIRNRRSRRKIPNLKYWLQGASILPLLLLFIFFVAFDQVFLIFHQLLFHNDLWLFDPLTDPIIQVLPQVFFLALFIVTILYYEIYLMLIHKSIAHKLK